MLPFELIGTNGRNLTHCGRLVEESSSMLWKGGKVVSKKPNKGSRKVWIEFAQQIRHLSATSVKCFYQDCQWKCLLRKK